MNKTPRTLFKLMCATVVPTVLVSSLYVSAEPGILQNVPFSAVSTDVQPNILFILDDSGSMNSEILRRDGVEENGRLDLTPNTLNEFLRLCVGFNTLAYDPEVNYLPWRGEDNDSIEFRRQVATAARINPFFTNTNEQSNVTANNNGGSFTPGTLGTVNLEGLSDTFGNASDPSSNVGIPGYIRWLDRDPANPASAQGDGIYQDGECPLFAADGSSNFFPLAGLGESVSNDSSLPFDTRENFATWYSFYRNRAYLAKNSLLSVVELNRQRVGVTGLFNNNADGILIRDIDNIRLSDGTPEDDTRIANANNNKDALMRAIAMSPSGGVTPLARTLVDAGEFFTVGKNIPNNFFSSANPTYNVATDDTLSTNSPILNAQNGGVCQANFSILLTDGFANSTAGQNNFVNGVVGNADGESTVPPPVGGISLDGRSFADNFSGTLADVAMFYLETDLAPGTALPNEADINDPRLGGSINHQHMVTYTLAFGVTGTLSQEPQSVDDPFAWPEPQDLSATSIDDLRHAAWNGRGEFFTSPDPDQLSTDIASIFADIDARTQTTTAASSVSSGFIQSDSIVFQTEFDPADFTGNLFGLNFDINGIVNTTAGQEIFNVQDELNAQVNSDNGVTGAGNSAVNAAGFTSTRRIFTKQVNTADILTAQTTVSNSPTSLQTGTGINFSFNELSTSQQDIFTGQIVSFPDWVGSDANAFGVALLNYVRGDSTNEQDTPNTDIITGDPSPDPSGQRVFRDRNQRYLGAIVNSSPQFVAVPNELYPDQIEGSDLYSTFVSAQANRDPVVYVGANDGMLHAFDASVNSGSIDASGNAIPATPTGSSGTEVFAYIPALLMDDLPQLAQPSFQFDSFVDDTPTIRDIYNNGGVAGGADEWRTYLVSGLRNGGRGIFALDVTDPNAPASDIVRFEYTHPDLGFTFSRTQIARMNDGSWVAVVGNGYNSVGDGRAKLFIIDLETGLPLDSAGPGTSDGIFDTGVGSIINNLCTDAGSDCNGLSEPTIVDLDGDFITDRIYAGDLHGNIWVFNVESANPSEWTMTRLFTATQSNCTVGTATDCRQPITTRPVVTLHPSRRSFSTEPNVLVLFGTGQFIAEGDSANTENQTFYSVWDTTGVGVSGTITNNNLTKADLVSRTFGGTIDDITITGPVAGYNTSLNLPLRNFGWYIDLAGSIAPAGNPTGSTSDPFDRGRVSINPIISGSVVFFVTTIPSGGIVCVPGEIPGFLTALDVESGQTPDFAVFFDDLGNEISSSTIQLNNGAVGLDLDTTSNGRQTRVTNLDGSITQDRVSDSEDIPLGRKAWSILR